jgi:hypothetical protein
MGTYERAGAPRAAAAHRLGLIILTGCGFVIGAPSGEAVAAHAADAPTAAQIAACTPDAQHFCLQHVGSRDAIKACMIAHKSQLSESCRAAFR